jgi:hypothetical protein
MAFSLSLMFSHQQNWRTGSNRFYPEVGGWGGKQCIHTHISKCKNEKRKKNKNSPSNNKRNITLIVYDMYLHII